MSNDNYRGQAVFITNHVTDMNSTTTPLNAGQTYTGTADNVQNYTSVIVSVKTDKTGTLFIDFSVDGTNWDLTRNYFVAADVPETHRVSVNRKFFRVRFTNTSAQDQTYLRIQSILGNNHPLSVPLNEIVQEDADTTIVRSIESEVGIVTGKFEGYTIVNKYGRNPSIDTGTVPEDLWGGGGVYTGFPDAAETLQVFSSSTSDAAAGIGARTVRITGLDSNYLEITEDVTLNGTTAVTTTKSFLRAHTMRVLTAGSNGANLGEITVRQSTTTTNVLLNMLVGTNQTNNSAYTVPANKTAYLKKASGTILGSATASVNGAFRIRNFGEVFRQRRPFALNFGSQYREDIYGGIVLPEKTDIVIRIISSSANNVDVSMGYDLLVIENQ